MGVNNLPRGDFLSLAYDLLLNSSLFSMTQESPLVNDQVLDLYKKYQQEIHGDDPDEITGHKFQEFLCNSPIRPINEQERELGSFHIKYRLEGKLVGVSVIDVLPHCLSSVYFF